MLDNFRKSKNYEELNLLVHTYDKEMEHIEVHRRCIIDSGLFVIEKIACDLLPKDIPDQRNLKLPVRVCAF